jgi:hypothetical protein
MQVDLRTIGKTYAHLEVDLPALMNNRRLIQPSVCSGLVSWPASKSGPLV